MELGIGTTLVDLTVVHDDDDIGLVHILDGVSHEKDRFASQGITDYVGVDFLGNVRVQGA